MQGGIIISAEIDTKDFDSQIQYIESKMLDIEDKLKQADMGFEVGDTQKLEAEYEKLGNQLIDLNKKQQKYNDAVNQTSKIGLADVKTQLNGIGNSIEGVIKKVTRWGLAVFGIRSAFRFIRSSMSELSSRNEQLATDVEYIRFALASTLAPVIEKIVQLARKLLFYIGYIAKAWFGVNIFAGATQKAFEGGNKSLKTANKQAKDLKKTLAGFDEMNVLQDTSDKSSAGGGDVGGATAPSFDLSGLEGEVPEWIKWIAENKDLILGVLEGIAIAIGALKLAQLLKTLGLFSSLPLWQLVAGIGLIIAGLVIAIKGVIAFIKEPSWKNFLTILEGIALVVAGIAILMGGWVVALIALAVALVAYVIKNWDKVKKVLSKVGTWINDKIIKPVARFFSNLWSKLKTGAKNAWEGIKGVFKNVANWFKEKVIDKIVNKMKTLGSKVGGAIGGAFKTAINGVLSLVENILNSPIRTINSLIGIINKLPKVNISTLPTFNLPRLAKGGVLNNPGKGVYTGSAIAGEAGRELYVPLQDEQMLSMVGEAIGKYVSLNATIPVYVGNRLVSREMKRVETSTNFAMNR